MAEAYIVLRLSEKEVYYLQTLLEDQSDNYPTTKPILEALEVAVGRL